MAEVADTSGVAPVVVAPLPVGAYATRGPPTGGVFGVVGHKPIKRADMQNIVYLEATFLLEIDA